MAQPIPDIHPPEVKYRVAKEDLEEFARLLKSCAKHFEALGEESWAVECEQTAEFIEGYYLPYPAQR